ncbi:MAG: hypothetical protein RIC54_22775 [Thalassobaculum sp.]|uniref:hypothetical protein n=1 Tax=Thalassobaculum sp. TaxID=2022740 RepID=UPI0032EF56E6
MAERLSSRPIPPPLLDALRRHESDEVVRQAQQGLGRPVVAFEANEHQLVAVGNTIHWSKTWRTFADFLEDYIKKTLGGEWGQAELGKSLADRHPILQWYDAFLHHKAGNPKGSNGLHSGPITGAVRCYLGLAYSLYLLSHNVELQARLVARLKDVKQFQGAYYELIVANCLIRAGFLLELEDEADEDMKHCEFAARSQTTGKRYWVEAKMRSVAGRLGKTKQDGTTSKDPTSQMTKHIRGAFGKPAPDERMIFVDLNTEPESGGGEPMWADKAIRRLTDSERGRGDGQAAYIFTTNMPFHLMLASPDPGAAVLAYGMGIPDFAKPEKQRISEWYRQKQKHIDAYNVLRAIQSYPQIPETFDGRPASEVFDKSRRLRIGDTYFFEDAGENGLVGEVTSVAVGEEDKELYVAVLPKDGSDGVILTKSITESELEDYRKYGDAYFGAKEVTRSEAKDIHELYESMVKSYVDSPLERLLELAEGRPDIKHLKSLGRDDIVLELCEGWVAAIARAPQAPASK